MSLSVRIRSAVLAAAAAASFAGGIGIADAAVADTTAGSAHSTTTDVAPPARATLHSRHHSTGKATSRSAASAAYNEFSAMTTASGARIRASVPNGRILGTTDANQSGNVGCKIPASDGHLWAYVGFRTTNAKYTTGFMRDDLFKVWVVSGAFWTNASILPWC